MISSLCRNHNIKNDINFQTRNISASIFFMHIFNFFVTYEELIYKFTEYALLSFIQYMHWSKIDLLQNAVNLSTIIFLALNFFMYIFNMSVIYLPSTKMIH